LIEKNQAAIVAMVTMVAMVVSIARSWKPEALRLQVEKKGSGYRFRTPDLITGYQ